MKNTNVLKWKLQLDYCKYQKVKHFKLHSTWSGLLFYFEFSKFAIIIDKRI